MPTLNQILELSDKDVVKAGIIKMIQQSYKFS